MMKDIYQQATDVIVWLGRDSDNSELAMKFIAEKGFRPLKPKANGFHQTWTFDQGKALLALCERDYWRRIWVVQEIIHAQNITVRCGQRTFPWRAIENIYYKLKAIEFKGYHYQRKHPFAVHVLNSAVCTMLVRVFRGWQCSDIRDKVNALNDLAVPETSVVIEYKTFLQQVFEAARNATPAWEEADDDLMREVLGIPYPWTQHNRLSKLCDHHPPHNEMRELRYNATWDRSQKVVVHHSNEPSNGRQRPKDVDRRRWR